MRALVQRVHRASVTVDDDVVGRIGRGLLVFVGVTHDDTVTEAARVADKVANLRVFPTPRDDPDDDRNGGRGSGNGPETTRGGMEVSLRDTGGAVLVVSQFTLYGDTRKGRRPSWGDAAPPELAEPLVDAVVAGLRAHGLPVSTGRFRAHMDVDLCNDGPVTLSIEVTAGR